MTGVSLVLGCLLITSITTLGCRSIAKGDSSAMPKLKHAYTSIQDEQVLAKHLEGAYFAGGCFWGVQDEFNHYMPKQAVQAAVE
jgi:hypothetical protein